MMGCMTTTETTEPAGSVDDAADEVASLVAGVNATTAEIVKALGAIADDGRWCGPGHRSFGHWASIEFGIPSATANSMVETAQALKHLPTLAACFATGEVGFDKVKVAAPAATPATDGAFVDMVRHGSVEQLRRICSSLRKARDPEPDEKDRRTGRGVWIGSDPDRQGLVEVMARIAPEDAALIASAIDAHVEAEWRDQQGRSADADDAEGDGDETPRDPRPMCQRRADGLVELASTGLAAGPTPCVGGERHQVILHVAAHQLALPRPGQARPDTGVCAVENGFGFSVLPVDTARRLACDAAVTTVLLDGLNRPLGVGRTTKQPPRWIRRALRQRDGGCAYPGCAATRWVHAHHIWHWIDGGPTNLDNLILLCPRHHRLLHEGGYTIRHDPKTEHMTFHRPDGRTVMRPPQAATAADRARAGPRAGIPLRARSGGAPAWSLADTVQALLDTDATRERAGPDAG